MPSKWKADPPFANWVASQQLTQSKGKLLRHAHHETQLDSIHFRFGRSSSHNPQIGLDYLFWSLMNWKIKKGVDGVSENYRQGTIDNGRKCGRSWKFTNESMAIPTCLLNRSPSFANWVASQWLKTKQREATLVLWDPTNWTPYISVGHPLTIHWTSWLLLISNGLKNRKSWWSFRKLQTGYRCLVRETNRLDGGLDQKSTDPVCYVQGEIQID